MIFGRVQTQTDDRRVHFWTNEHNQWQLIREVWYVKENKNDVCGCLKDSTLRAIITNKGENRFIFTLKNRIQPRTLRDVNVTSAGFLLGLVSEPVHSCETERSPEVLNREILTAQLQTCRRTFKAEYLSSKRISEEFFFSVFLASAEKTFPNRNKQFHVAAESETLPAHSRRVSTLWFSSHSGLMSHGLSALPVNVWLQNELTTVRRALRVSAAAPLRLKDSTICEESVSVFSWI